jgi:LPXTG-motif cell wall-anchored protein
VEASPVTALAAGVTDEGGSGPPIGALLALVAVIALGAGGWFMRRRQNARGGG